MGGYAGPKLARPYPPLKGDSLLSGSRSFIENSFPRTLPVQEWLYFFGAEEPISVVHAVSSATFAVGHRLSKSR